MRQAKPDLRSKFPDQEGLQGVGQSPMVLISPININLAVSCQWQWTDLKPSLKGKVALRSNDGRVLTNAKFIVMLLRFVFF